MRFGPTRCGSLGRYDKAEASTPIYKLFRVYTNIMVHLRKTKYIHNNLLKSLHSWLYKSLVWFVEVSNIYLDYTLEAIRHLKNKKKFVCIQIVSSLSCKSFTVTGSDCISLSSLFARFVRRCICHFGFLFGRRTWGSAHKRVTRFFSGCVACVAGGLVRRRKIRWGEFDFWRHVEQYQKEVKNCREGGGVGDENNRLPANYHFLFPPLCISRTIWPIGRRPSPSHQIAIEAWH